MEYTVKPGNKPQSERQGHKAKKLSKKFKRDRLKTKYSSARLHNQVV